MSTNEQERQFETVQPVAYVLDGAPEGYSQLYADDEGPFVFPIASPFITKRLTSPPTARVMIQRKFIRAYSWLIAWGVLAAAFHSVPLLLLAAAGFAVSAASAWRLLLEELEISLSLLRPRFRPVMKTQTLGGVSDG